MPSDILFEPLRFRTLTVKNRLFRSSISGRLDNYDGSGTDSRGPVGLRAIPLSLRRKNMWPWPRKTRVRTRDRVLVDIIRLTPVDRYQRALRLWGAAAVVVAAIALFHAYLRC